MSESSDYGVKGCVHEPKGQYRDQEPRLASGQKERFFSLGAHMISSNAWLKDMSNG